MLFEIEVLSKIYFVVYNLTDKSPENNIFLVITLPDEFISVADSLLLDPKYQNDSTFMAGIREIDRKAIENGVSFYEMWYMKMNESIANKRAREWLKETQSDRTVYSKETLKHIFYSI